MWHYDRPRQLTPEEAENARIQTERYNTRRPFETLLEAIKENGKHADYAEAIRLATEAVRPVLTRILAPAPASDPENEDTAPLQPPG